MTKTMSINSYHHRFQPTGNSCGPTCLKIALGHLVQGHDCTFTPSIEEISELCGTDWIVGTPPDRMEKGMKELCVDYIEYLGSTKSYDLLKKVIDNNNVPILRTITQDVPHWIVIGGYTEYVNTTMFNILDPWLGEIQYSIEQLDDIWKVRNYQFFELIKFKRSHENVTN